MRRVFLVNGDAAQRERIRAGLPWDRIGFALVGEAADGESALPMIRDLRPDVLIAGERLPIMGGFDLALAVQELFPWAQVVLLGADDSPAKRHRMAQACMGEYLLEPVRALELEEALKRAAARVESISRKLQERMQRANRDVPKERRDRERAMSQWLETGVLPENPPWTRQARYCRAMTLTGADGRLSDAVRGILRLMEARYSDRMRTLELDRGPMLVTLGNDLARLENLAYGTAYTVLCAAERLAGEQVRIQIGRCAADERELRESWLELRALEREQTDRRPILGPGDAMRACPGECPEICALAEQALGLETTEVRGALEHCARVGTLSPGDVAKAADKLIAEASALRDGAKAMVNAGSLDDMCEQLRRVVEYRDLRAPQLRWLPLNRARQYIAEHYGNPGLLLHGAAREAGMSEHRFCVVFEQEMGMTFTDYLFQMRVNVAKALLTTTHMRVNSIANAVGFNEPDYFASIFRRYAGMDPRAYRRAHAER